MFVHIMVQILVHVKKINLKIVINLNKDFNSTNHCVVWLIFILHTGPIQFYLDKTLCQLNMFWHIIFFQVHCSILLYFVLYFVHWFLKSFHVITQHKVYDIYFVVICFCFVLFCFFRSCTFILEKPDPVECM